MPTDHDLLRPSLGDNTPAAALYSPTACWMTAFFGGPIAALVIFAVNFSRAGVLKRESTWFGAAVVVVIAALAYILQWMLELGEMPREGRLLVRACALVVAALLYWRLRPMFRAQEMFGRDSPNPWPIALGATAVNFVAMYLLVLMVK